MMNYVLNFNAEEFSKEGDAVINGIGKAVISAAIEMKNRARNNLKNTPYKLEDVANKGILLGTLKKDYKVDNSVKLHAFGHEGKGSLARIFVGGKGTPRFNWYKKGKYLNTPRLTGYIKPIAAIEKALDQSILDNKINEVLNKNI